MGEDLSSGDLAMGEGECMTNLGGLFVYRSPEQGGGGGGRIDWGYLDDRISLYLWKWQASLESGWRVDFISCAKPVHR